MRKINIKVILAVICLLFFGGTTVLCINMYTVGCQSESTTTIYTATVKIVDIKNTGADMYIDIYTQEYSAALTVPTAISQYLSTDELPSLENGQEIVFRIANEDAPLLESELFVEITALQAGENEIFTLEMYNAYMEKAAQPAKIVAPVVATVFLVAAVYFYWASKKTTAA